MPHGGRLAAKTSNCVADEALTSRWGSVGRRTSSSYRSKTLGSECHRTLEPHILSPFSDEGRWKELRSGFEPSLRVRQTVWRVWVTVSSAPGEGTLFKVFLQRSPETSPATRLTPAVIPTTGTGVVLVVEDDAAVRMTTSGMLEDPCYLVVSAETGNAARKIVQRKRRARFGVR